MDADTMRALEKAMKHPERKGQRLHFSQEDGRLHLQERRRITEGAHQGSFEWVSVQMFAGHRELAGWLGVA